MSPISLPKPDTYVDMRVAILTAPNPAPREVLAAVGDLARRSERHAVPEDTLTAALQSLRAADVTLALSELDPSTCEESLGRAAAEAFEAAFADSPEERELFAEAAIAGLLVRDRVESLVFAARRFMAATGDDPSTREALEAVTARFAQVDEVLANKLARSLTGINQERRACLDELDSEVRGAAPWFSLRLDGDGLLEALAGNTEGASASVAADLARSELPRFVTKKGAAARDFDAMESSALFHMAIGTANPAERELLALRAERDEALSLAIRDVLEDEEEPAG